MGTDTFRDIGTGFCRRMLGLLAQGLTAVGAKLRSDFYHNAAAFAPDEINV